MKICLPACFALLRQLLCLLFFFAVLFSSSALDDVVIFTSSHSALPSHPTPTPSVPPERSVSPSPHLQSNLPNPVRTTLHEDSLQDLGDLTDEASNTETPQIPSTVSSNTHSSQNSQSSSPALDPAQSHDLNPSESIVSAPEHNAEILEDIPSSDGQPKPSGITYDEDIVGNKPIKKEVPIDQVFIPLKEWKKRKLEDIELKVRQFENGGKQMPLKVIKIQGKGQKKVMSSMYSLRRLPFFPFLSRPRLCSYAEAPGTNYSVSSDAALKKKEAEKQGAKNGTLPAAVGKLKPLSSNAVPHVAVEYGLDLKKEAKRVMESPSASVMSDAQAKGVVPDELKTSDEIPTPQYYNDSVVSREAEPRKVEAEKSESPELDEITAQDDYGFNLGSRLTLPIVMPLVGDIVRSIKGVSNSLSPLATAIEDPVKSCVGANKSSVLKKTTVRKSSYCQRSGNASSQKQEKGPGCEFENDAQKMNPPLLQNSVQLEDEHIQGARVRETLQVVKEKPFNFASADAGARVLSYSTNAVGAKNVIQESVDKYMLAPCAGDGIGGSRWVDLELSEDVILERVEIGNFEFYSSSARRIAVLGASSYPPKQWTVLGVFDFSSVRSLQRFPIEKRVVTRYLRILFAGKQGREYYCPISSIRAFGKNLLADWKDVFENKNQESLNVGGLSSGRVQDLSKGAREAREKAGAGRRWGTETSLSEENKDCVNCNTQSFQNEKHSENQGKGRVSSEKNEDVTSPKSGELNGDRNIKTEGLADTNKYRQENNSGMEYGVKGDKEKDIDGKQREEKEGVKKEVGTAAVGEEGENVQKGEREIGEAMSEEDQLVLEAMRSETLSPGAAEDNIFRKVTRMIRVLELNQTLTNQYIDTQLSKFASALRSVHSNCNSVDDRVVVIERRFERLRYEKKVITEELNAKIFRRDMTIGVFSICLAFLFGMHWVLWTAVTGSRLGDLVDSRRISMEGELGRSDGIFQDADNADSRCTNESETSSGRSVRRRRRKGRRA